MSGNDPYFIDFPKRVKDVQAAMQAENIDVYLGSRLRTLSWILDAFCPWRSFLVIPSEGTPTAFTFVIDAARVADDSWLDEDQVLGFVPIGGQDQIDSFLSQWGRAKLYWVSVLFEAVFLWLWWVFTFHRGAFGRLNGRRDLQIAFSPFLLFIPYYLGYAPYLFTFGPSGGILYPAFALLVSIPFTWFPFNPVEIWILQHIPHPLWYIAQVPVGMMAISFWASVSPTALLLFAGIVQILAFSWRKRRR